MPRYVSLFRYTPEALGRMVRNPADRAEAAREAIEKAGGTLDVFHWMLGEYDGLVIYTMPSEVEAAAFSATVTSSGRLASHVTHQLLDVDQSIAALSLAQGVSRSYRAPGGGEWRVEYDAMG